MKKRILIVEDDPMISKLLFISLSDQYDLAFAKNGEEGIERYRLLKDSLSLVITDFQMPIKNGDEVALFVRSNDSTIPILFASGSDWRDLSPKLAVIPNLIVIAKPIRVVALREVISNLINSPAERRPAFS
ncbi:MAG: response regulator [Chloroherpetonaceae bacterium]|nr:response regulator [Chloroherpetonaceae bacterium]